MSVKRNQRGQAFVITVLMITALLGITQPITRYEHSVGVMLLARRVGGGLREQVAALLHDVSHTAFSHVIDHVFHDQARRPLAMAL